jgi:uncharacterized protein YecE (DUF72 family)
MAVRIGTSGWVYRHWRGPFYPPSLPARDWFGFYAARFDTVEINNSFYRLPTEAAVDGWRAQAPSGFVYAMKASRYLTHMKKLGDPADPLERILGRARRLGAHLGPLLYQLPPRWHCDPERLSRFVDDLPADLMHVLEFRDPSWCNDEIREILERRGIGWCIHDMAGFDCFPWVTGRIAFFRFHGPRKYAGRYDRGFLAERAAMIRDIQAGGRDVYAYFNNDEGGNAVFNALELRDLVGQI